MKLVIRKPEVRDAERISVICSTGWRETVEGQLSKTFQQQTVNYWYSSEKIIQDIKKGSYSFVAETEGTVAGVIGGGMTGGRSAEVYVLYIDKKYRYHGIGKALLHKLTEHHQRKGAKKQWVSVQENNELGMPFYKARGFVQQSVKKTKSAAGEVQVSLRMKRDI
ncbi:N-acetyltransferase [Jeotgalicoccus coquinae]|uniref:Acetyltransferase YpeA n=1 Tax=Jeotgalicoccus coquinae TaxID=709509 RepID=A0A6V7RTL3_9STAP|nr:GNAT family N-acetyltransferase [Jeotgalicoccus coquinae]MBB6424260.1 ribosomal protein S18 acetylase RimI-like enzyme [Jeotgalicoccus coquinae]GGE25219.1 N-acetyltransferase [Jeotgalicoccus coquinae]CAD2081605.1 Acetyltransferase YpeA [Jeotgalicoccus coquinae]